MSDYYVLSFSGDEKQNICVSEFLEKIDPLKITIIFRIPKKHYRKISQKCRKKLNNVFFS
jgi:hypothetical protein